MEHERDVRAATICCAAVLFVSGYTLQVFAFSMPGLVSDWQLPDTLVGPLLAAAMLGLMLGYVAIAPLADRIGERQVVSTAMTALALACLASLFAPGFASLAACRFAIGAAGASAIPAAVSIVSQQGEERWRGARVVAVYTGYSLGFLVAALVSGWLIPRLGWRAPWALGVPAALGAALFARALPASGRGARAVSSTPSRARTTRVPVQSLSTLLQGDRRLGTVLFWILFPTGLSLFYTLQSWLPLLATRGGSNFSGAVAVTGAFTLGNMLGAVPMIWSSDRIGPLRALAAMGLFALAGLAILALSHRAGGGILLTAALLAGIGIGGGQKGMTSAASLFYPPAMRATGLGWALGIGRIGAVGGPVLLGLGQNVHALAYALPLPFLLLVLIPVWLDRHYGRIDRHATPST